ncbi:hypothetical protein [Edaphobacter albus]|uniref:hypothetical protein n=1 Tax=Edaphobacter sp. 4G125 TaxID=2763071 RepID=UPI0016472C9E|nr:hypothetical protein [Edaphobacter sp. 4G125]QNI35321.1 hypothetical protein H7846_09425 [Edaphobacter sp. 4G125]
MAISFGRLRAVSAGLIVLFSAALPSLARAEARFDLSGPRIDVRVTRDGKTLPIAAVPNLKEGDKLWLFADLPRTQSVHYLLVAAFLRGTTNPPPSNWFFKIETWNKKVREEGATITVPEGAQQALLFLAPETGGDFSTLRSAVQGRPGIFVRASQDLTEAGFEQARIEKYLASIKLVPPSDPKALQEHSTLLARTLSLRPNQECFTRPVDQQYNCLTQSGTQTLLDDGHGQTVVSMISRTDTSALIGAAASTQIAGGGIYSAYVGAVVDLVRLMGNLHTAQYQYIPAIAFPQDEQLNLRLNTAPSFHNPKSVIVIGLPAIQNATPPPLRASNPRYVTCLLRPDVVLPVEGAPLVFSTGFAHDLVLHINGSNVPRADVPLTPDPFKGGLVLSSASERKSLPLDGDSIPASSTKPSQPSAPRMPTDPGAPNTPVTGTITGYWGFDPFVGPTLPLQDVAGTSWKLANDSILIIGRENHLALSSSGTACVQSITFERFSGRQTEAQWKQSDRPNIVDVSLSLKSVDPGDIHVNVHQYGEVATAAVTAQTFSEPAQLEALTFHAGDASATLRGTNLDQVHKLTLGGMAFTPSGEPASAPPPAAGADQQTETLTLALPFATQPPDVHAGDRLMAHVALRDGRTLSLPLTVNAPRPSITMLRRSTTPASSPIHLSNPDDLPITQKLTFSLRSALPFPRNGKIEIANADETLRTSLTIASGLILQNSHTVLGTFDPLKAFGTSAFGPVRLRAISPDGTAGDWIPLATLVRLPTFHDIHCPSDPAAACTLTGSGLYLVDSLASDAAFTNPVDVPEGFVGDTLSIPRPPRSGFYLKLRDESESANLVNMPVQIPRAPAPPPQAAPVAVAPPVAPPTANPPAIDEPTPTPSPQPATSTTTSPVEPKL